MADEVIIETTSSQTVEVAVPGPQGPTGATGATGPQGPKGDDGSVSYILKTESFNAEPRKAYAVDTSAVDVVPAVLPTLTAGGLVFAGTSQTQTTYIELNDYGYLGVDYYDEAQISISIEGGVTTLQDVIDALPGTGVTASLASGYAGTDFINSLSGSLSGGSAASTTTIPLSVTLPASPITGDVIAFADARNTWHTNPPTVLRNGKPIEAVSANFVNSQRGSFFSLVFVDEVIGWRVLASGTVPMNLVAPAITGTAAVGATLTVHNGSWTGSPTSYEYQWQISDDGLTGWADIGSTNQTYVVGGADEDKYLRAVVIAMNSNGPSSPAITAPTTQIIVLPFPMEGLLAFWKLDDLTDASGDGNTLTNNNGVTFGAGKIGDAAIVTSSSYLSCDLNVASGTEDCSFSVWLFDDNNSFQVAPLMGELAAGKFWFYLAGGRVYFTPTSFTYNVAYGGTYAQGNWFHAAAVIASEVLTLYVNGAVVATVSWTDGTLGGSYPTDSSIVHINSPSSEYGFNGKVDAVGIWNRALSATEIARLYNNGNGAEPA